MGEASEVKHCFVRYKGEEKRGVVCLKDTGRPTFCSEVQAQVHTVALAVDWAEVEMMEDVVLGLGERWRAFCVVHPINRPHR